MKKAKKGTKPPTKKRDARKPAAKTKAGVTFSGARARGSAGDKPKPRSQVLPGMEQVRDVALDRLCEDIGDARERMNSAKADEQSSIQSALQRMQKSSDRYPGGRTVYRHAGVELARIPGADKLRVRLTKEQGDAEDNDQVGDERRDAVEELGEDGGGEAGDELGQDASGEVH